MTEFTMRVETEQTGPDGWAWWLYRRETGEILALGAAGSADEAEDLAHGEAADIRMKQVTAAFRAADGGTPYIHMLPREDGR